MYWLAIVPALPIWWSLCSGFSHAELVASELPHTVQARNPPPPKKARIDGNVFLFRGEMGERRKPSDIRQLGGFAPAEAGYQHHQSAFRMAHHMTGDLEEESDDVGSSDADTDSSSVDSSGERLWYTAFVSLSHHPDLAASYAEDDGFLYIIHSAPNMIDPRRDDVLRQLSSVNREVLALGGVQFSQPASIVDVK
ncbi:hypothetical protein XA68_13951 [Ophiocordyceps unilateralis]|uniref:Uncharacterized protein n=1 Tax=Ophiocordyceps unilateralis TaxID=268505 RepID=A0A2A9PN88_OPHUN|nr:hypothetical protein XA68_13951 [Ophiocordyceps unilateralis]